MEFRPTLAKPTAQQCHALTSYYIAGFREKYGSEPKVNRNIARNQFSNMLLDMTPAEARDLIDYYFKTQSPKRHDLTWFFYNYDKLLVAKEDTDADRARREELRRASEQRAKEWLERGNRGISSDE